MYINYEDENGIAQTREVRFPLDDAGRIATWHTEVAPLLDRITGVLYEYPLVEYIWLNENGGLLSEAGVQLVHLATRTCGSVSQPLGIRG